MEELDLKELLSVFLKNKFIVLLIVIFTTILGNIYSFYLVTPKYEASTTLILGRINNSTSKTTTTTTDQITQSEISINSNLVSTYSELIKSRTLIQQVIDNLKLNLSETSVRNSITVSRISDTELIEITVKNEDGELASKIANEIAKVFSTKVEEVYNISNVYIIDKAIATNVPYNINHIKDIVIFMFIGIVISGVYILIYHLLDNTIKSESQIERNIGLKNLINIPFENKKGKKQNQNELITYLESKSIVSESFRTLRTNVQFSKSNLKGGKTFLISSCFPSEGKSYISANLAITFAQIGKKVILVDSDMRRGRQAEIFKISNGIGLSNYISGLDRNGMEISEDIGRFIRETEISNLNLITAGSIPPNPSELLSLPKLQELIESLKSFYDIIIFDGAPIIPITDSLILARNLESTIIVTLYNKTKKDDLIKVKNDIEAVGGKIIGTCINCMPVNSSKKESKYYYYREEKSKSKITLKARIYKIFNKIVWKCKSIKTKLKLLTKRKKIATLTGEVSTEFAKNSKKEEKILTTRKEKIKKDIELNAKIQENKAIEQTKRQEKMASKNELKNNIQQSNLNEKNDLKHKEAEKEKIENQKKEQDKIREQEEKLKAKETLKAEKEKEKQRKLKEQQEKNVEKQKIKDLMKEGKAKEKEQNKKNKEEKKKIAKEHFNEFKEKSSKVLKSELEKLKENGNNFVQKVKEILKSKSEELNKKYDEYITKKAKERLEQERIKLEKEEQKKQKAIEEEKERIERENIRKQKEIEFEKIKLEKEELRRQKEIEFEKWKLEKEEIKKQKAIEQEKIRQEREAEKAKEKEDAKLTDEYIEENLYPKTKNTKLF